ncbi:hypothetical protein C8R45DRAFT_1114213 [Mycena sanguinolenta]|nr:hypothetical protein C8R45DRAFT_1114213 [Mycena sanguinolenta]
MARDDSMRCGQWVLGVGREQAPNAMTADISGSVNEYRHTSLVDTVWFWSPSPSRHSPSGTCQQQHSRAKRPDDVRHLPRVARHVVWGLKRGRVAVYARQAYGCMGQSYLIPLAVRHVGATDGTQFSQVAVRTWEELGTDAAYLLAHCIDAAAAAAVRTPTSGARAARPSTCDRTVTNSRRTVDPDNHALIMTVASIYKLHRANLCVTPLYDDPALASRPTSPSLTAHPRPPMRTPRTSSDQRTPPSATLDTRHYLLSLPTPAPFATSTPAESVPARIADGEHLAPGATCATVP